MSVLMMGLNCLTPIWDVSLGSKAGLGVLFDLGLASVPGLVFGASVTSFALETSDSGLAFGASGTTFARVVSAGSESKGLNGLGAAARSANASSMSMFLNMLGSGAAAGSAGLGSSVFSEAKSLPEKRSSLMLGFFAPAEDFRVVFFLASRPLANSMPNSVRDRPSPPALRSTMRPRDARRLMEESLPVDEEALATDWRTA